MNIPRLGFVGKGVTLMARITNIAGEWYLAQSAVNRTVSQVYEVPLPGDLPVPRGVPIFHPASERFPWSYEVEKDNAV